MRKLASTVPAYGRLSAATAPGRGNQISVPKDPPPLADQRLEFSSACPNADRTGIAHSSNPLWPSDDCRLQPTRSRFTSHTQHAGERATTIVYQVSISARIGFSTSPFHHKTPQFPHNESSMFTLKILHVAPSMRYHGGYCRSSAWGFPCSIMFPQTQHND